MRARERVAAAYDRVVASARGDVWISLRGRAEVLAEAAAVDARAAAGEVLPLAGLTVGVKDNIDVAHTPTTAGCPAFASTPGCDAPAVARLRAAGAVVLGKTNLDQFATGLVGTRSPYGAVADPRHPDRVAGGSSSGSAVAVALGHVDLALGTDTAGSGRVPAAFCGLVGIKPTRGLVPVAGVVPACRSFDCVTVFAADLALAEAAMRAIEGPWAGDPLSRAWPAGAALAAPPHPTIAVPHPGELASLGDGERTAFAAAALDLAERCGAELVELDLVPFLTAGRLLYEGAFVAERAAAVGTFVAAHRDLVDPIVGSIIAAAGAVTATALAADTARLDALRLTAMAELARVGADALLLPTAPGQPTIAEVAADPVGVNARLGTFTTFANLLDMCAIALPAGQLPDGRRFGVSLLAPAFGDLVIADLAHRFAGTAPVEASGAAAGIPLLVVGAHMSGLPLNGELTRRGGRLVRECRTADGHRLYALATEPAKPGLVAGPEAGVGVGVGAGGAIAGELWRLPPAGLASLLAELPEPMALGPVRLEDGSTVVGFLCQPRAVVGAREITVHGGWRSYLAAGDSGGPQPLITVGVPSGT